MSEIDPTKLKVAELREELKSRGLDTKGVKAVLAKRLIKALNAEKGVEDADVSVGELDTTTEEDQSFSDPPRASEPVVEPEPTAEPDLEPILEAASEPEPTPVVEPTPEPVSEPVPEPISEAVQQPEPVSEPVKQPEPVSETVQQSEPVPESVQDPEPVAAVADQPAETAAEPTQQTGEPMRTEEPMQDDSAQNGDNSEQVSGPQEGEEYQTIDEATDDTDEKSDRNRKRKRSSSRDRHRSRSDDKRRSRSRDRERRPSPPRRKVEMDDEAWETGTDIMIDRYNCDLNLRVDANGIKAQPLSVEGFAFMWAGARAMFGIKSGKVAYEVKLLENLNVDHLPSEESNPHVLRVGWSTDSTSLQLGEEPFSYGFGGTGKASTNCEFKDYGQTFTQGDVITVYLDLESEPATISYSKNGEDLGTCYEVEKATLEDKAIYPHILTKNTEYECNFGKREEPFFPLKEEFMFVEAVPQEDKVRGAVPPAKKEDCEMIMMVGLPGAGKTTWATKHAESNPDKKFNMLGTNNVIDKMKVMGLPRKRNYTGRWDVLIDMATKCLNRAIEIAARKKRNYILDQTNVYGSARRRKMQPFEGFQRKAVVILPSDEDFKSRIAQREKEEGKDIPEKAVLDMKANFSLPEEGQLFDAVEFVELIKEEAEKLTEVYRKEGLAANPERRWRGSDRWSGRDNRDYRNDRYNRNSGGYKDYKSKGYDRHGGGGYGGGYNSGYGGGGYRNDRYDRNRNSGGGKYDRNSGYSGSNWGKNQGWGNQGWGNQGWGNQGWGQGYGGGWGGYNQSGSGGYNQGWGSGWGNQNYWQGYQGTGSTTTSSSSSSVPDYSQWYGQYNNSSSSTGTGGSSGQSK